MLTKRLLPDGGIDVEAKLAGPAVFLDVWAVRDLSGDATADLRARLAVALAATNGSLLVSTAWVTELGTIKGNARTRAQNLLSSLGARWLPIDPVVSAVATREARDTVSAALSLKSLRGFVEERCGELLRQEENPHSLSDAKFFDLGRTLVWTCVDDPDAEHLVRGLKDAAKVRADADRDEARRDSEAPLRLYPRLPFAFSPVACAHNAVWREVTRRSRGRTWVPNDGFDIVHLVPALGIGGLIAVDSDWQDIGECAAADLPAGHVRLYRPGELPLLVSDLEGC